MKQGTFSRAAILLLMMLTASSAWAQFATIDGINYKFYSDATVTDNSSFTGTTVNIPDKVQYKSKSYDVTQIEAGAFKDNTSITSVNIGGKVQFINDMAFQGCTNLATLTFSEGPNIAIKDCAFKRCGLTSLTIPSRVASLGDHAFYDCDALTSLTIRNGISLTGTNAFSSCDNLTTVTITGSGTITTNNPVHIDAGGAKSNLTTLIIGDGITAIDNEAFRGCSRLTSLTIGSGVTTIGERAFYNSPLTNVTIPSGVTSIGERAFYSSDGPFVLNSNPKLGSRVFPTTDDVTVTMNLTANGPVDGYYWTTFYNDYANGNFQADENTKVYKGTVSGSSLVLTEVARNNTEFNRIVDAGTAVILKSTSSHPVMTMTSEESRDTHDNELQGVMERTLTSELGSGTPYVMGKVNDVFGFYQYTAEYMPAGKAYLLISGSAPEFLGFDENATSISSLTPIPSPTGEGSEGWFTLDGRKLDAQPTQKGVYIHGNKKIVIK